MGVFDTAAAVCLILRVNFLQFALCHAGVFVVVSLHRDPRVTNDHNLIGERKERQRSSEEDRLWWQRHPTWSCQTKFIAIMDCF